MSSPVRCRAGVLACVLVALIVGGCSSSRGPTVITIDAARYGATFEAAIDATRAQGLMPAHLDRRTGIIDTEPDPAGSVLEPWRMKASSFAQAIDNTLGSQRRRARVEFLPVPGAAVGADDTLPPADLLTPAPVDLTTFDGPIEVRVYVYVDTEHRPGERPGTWTLTRSETMVIVTPDGERLSGRYWVPVSRDTAFERRLLADIQRASGVSDS
jgi:hypothetical protein